MREMIGIDRVCNRPEILHLIFKQFKLMDGNLYRRLYESDPHSLVFGSTDRVYLYVEVASKRVMVHNIVAVLSSGKSIPANMVCDHIDGNKHNNHESNIRIVPHTVNNLNVSTCNKRSQSKHISIVQRRPGKWRVKFKLCRKEIDLGSFGSLVDAIQARDDAFFRLAPERYAAMHRYETL